MTLSQLKADYIDLRTIAEYAKDRYVQTKEMKYCILARSARVGARRTQQEIHKIEDRILVKKGQ